MRRQPRRVRGSLRWLLVAVVAVAILGASVIDPGPGVTSGPFGFLAVSTWLHVGAYGLLSLALLYALADGPALVHPAVVPVLVVAYGGLIEMIQAPIPYRTFAVADLLANGSGAVVATGIWFIGHQLLSAIDRGAA